VLATIRDINVPLISVTQVRLDSEDESQTHTNGGVYAD